MWYRFATVLCGIALCVPACAAGPASAADAIRFLGNAGAPKGEWILWYRHPATSWLEALPVGNGIMGAMVFGGVPVEHIQFNEYTVWTGQPHSYAHEGAAKFLPEIRRLLAQGKQKEAEALANRQFMSVPLRQKAYQPCGDLWIKFSGIESVSNYRRWLDLDTGTAITEYQAGETTFRREVFASYPDRVVVMTLSANGAERLNCLLRLSSPHARSSCVTSGMDKIILRGQVEEHGIHFESVAQVQIEDGTLSPEKEGIRISGASKAIVRLVAATNFKNFHELSADPMARCSEILERTAGRPLHDLLAAHTLDHQRLFRRASLDLGRNGAADLPTPERIERFATNPDPQLASLIFQYGRYLLIASSRPGGQPATLQGVWNEALQPPWDSKYTCNINTEMNYWPAEPGNLAECSEPLYGALEDLTLSGAETARQHYNARGWVTHHNFDLWRGSAPINAANHGIWVVGGAWMSLQMWEHYLFSGDKEFLRQRAYPVMKGAALFFLDYLVEDPKTEQLISGPSNSPEHGGLVMGPTMDHQIIRSLFKACVEAARALGTDQALAAQWARAWPRIAPNRVGQYGQLQEWLEDKDAPQNQHRHVSHLWGVYPGCDITWQDEKLFAAARQSLIFRGDAATGWSMGWKVNLWARFLEGDHAHLILRNLLQPIGRAKGMGGMYPNLFDAHPPFQIDGNFGAASGIMEMLLQSHVRESNGSVLHLLPALPAAWPKGSVKGLRARGGFTVDIAWQNGKVTEAVIQSDAGQPCTVRCGEEALQLKLTSGERYTLRPKP